MFFIVHVHADGFICFKLISIPILVPDCIEWRPDWFNVMLVEKKPKPKKKKPVLLDARNV